MSRLSPLFSVLLILLSVNLFSGCVVGQVAATPVTVVRDAVDAPLVSLTNVSEEWARRTDPWAAPQPGVSYTIRGGFDAGITYGLGFFVFKAFSGVFGSLDYVVCRSLYPNYPAGISPWKSREESWGSLYFPNTRALWGSDPPDTVWDDEEEAEKRAPAGSP